MTVLVKLLIAFVVPTTILFAVFAYVAHEAARRNLEAELGTRLAAIAGTAASEIRGRHLVGLGVGDEEDRAFLYNKRKLDAVIAATGVARVYIFDPEFEVKVSTDPDAPPGSEHYYAQLHRAEIAEVLATGEPRSTVLFADASGEQYLAGYAPVRASETDDEIVLVLGVDAAPTYFDRLASLRRNLMLYGAALVVVVMLIAAFVASRITRPVRSLVDAAERIGQGRLEAPIERQSRDEIGFLAETMDEMRRDLAARHEQMQMMLAGVAHEVRNPLGGMRLFTGILREEIDEGDERRDHVARLEKELSYLETVVSQFLDYARRPEPELDQVDLAELVGNVAELARARADDAGVSLTVDAGEVSARADAGQLRRALLNLMHNAIEAAGQGGEVAVEVGRAGKRATVAVANSGPPIADEIADRIFEPFFTTREKGTGLGLAFAREIARDHGGDLTFERIADRTTFVLSLPAA
jgi:signal transduction histidine kinase